jgi:feruloyl esterase
VTIAFAGVLVGPSAAATTSTAAGQVIRPVRGCSELKQTFEIPGASTHVESAEPVSPAGDQPPYCKVVGTVEPHVGFTLNLPTETYAGRYLQYGCQGLCGVTLLPDTFPACGAGGGDVAVAATDDGHLGQGGFPLNIMDGSWAASDQAARNDYFYRAPHVVSVAAKRIIAAFYGTPPVRSYFNGCSTGGREGLLAAQRYPHDFDGIIAGAPAHAMGPLFGIYFAWLAKTNQDAGGAPILTSDKVPALHNAVLAACDGIDGLVDGQIDDPRACRYDPVRLQCAAGTDLPTCLTPAQVAATRRLYDGPRDALGRRLYPGWESHGSELAWQGSVIPHPVYGGIAPLPDNYLKYVGYPIGAPHSSVADIDFTVRELNRLTSEGAKGNAMSLDLSEFRRAGGKLILWHGWDDQSIPAIGTVDYYQRLARNNGGLAATGRWARAFLVPTKYHCETGGSVLTSFDPLQALIDWIETGDAPDRIVASGKDTQGNDRTRPVFPYPLRAKYDGTGSVNDAANFIPAGPLVSPRHDILDWAGAYLHDVPGPVAP